MNNNRGNNRRRGRGNTGNNNRPQGGGQMVNRIDSRARGNAPQMLEKYRKMAHDAHLNGDRVAEETNLQFADHYFRVIADQRMRQEEQRVRRDDRGQDGAEPYREEAEETVSYGPDADYAAYDNTGGYNNARQRDDRPRDDRPREDRTREDRTRDDRPRDDRPREDRPRREERDAPEPREAREPREQRPRREPRAPAAASTDNDNGSAADSRQLAFDTPAEPAADQEPSFEPAENPFLRESRGSRGLKPRREERRPRRDERDLEEAAPALDPALLPPSISASISVDREEIADAAPAEPVAEEKPRRRTRRKPSADDAGETLESVG